MTALPPIVDQPTWQAELDALRVQKKAATRQLHFVAADKGVPPGAGFVVNVFGVMATPCTGRGRGTEQLGHLFGLLNVLPYGRQEQCQDSPESWPQSPTYSRWPTSQEIGAAYGDPTC